MRTLIFATLVGLCIPLHCKDQAKAQPDQPEIIVKPGANIRAQPSLNGRVVGNLKFGTTVSVLERGAEAEILGRRGAWVRVQVASGESGWIFEPLVGQGGSAMTVISGLLVPDSLIAAGLQKPRTDCLTFPSSFPSAFRGGCSRESGCEQMMLTLRPDGSGTYRPGVHEPGANGKWSSYQGRLVHFVGSGTEQGCDSSCSMSASARDAPVGNCVAECEQEFRSSYGKSDREYTLVIVIAADPQGHLYMAYSRGDSSPVAGKKQYGALSEPFKPLCLTEYRAP